MIEQEIKIGVSQAHFAHLQDWVDFARDCGIQNQQVDLEIVDNRILVTVTALDIDKKVVGQSSYARRVDERLAPNNTGPFDFDD